MLIYSKFRTSVNCSCKQVFVCSRYMRSEGEAVGLCVCLCVCVCVRSISAINLINYSAVSICSGSMCFLSQRTACSSSRLQPLLHVSRRLKRAGCHYFHFSHRELQNEISTLVPLFLLKQAVPPCSIKAPHRFLFRSQSSLVQDQNHACFVFFVEGNSTNFTN